MLEKIFFQSSLPRAGSTLLQNVMAQNPDFYVTPTSGLLELLYSARANYTNSPEFKAQDTELMDKAWKGFCSNAVNGYFNSITDKKYALDKSRGWGIHYNFLNFFYPNPKIICMVREPVDIFCSFEKKFRANQQKDAGVVNHAQAIGTTTEKRIDYWADPRQPIGMAFERLYQIQKEGIDKQMLFVRYENLASTPDIQMKRIYEYLELPYFQHDWNNIEQTTKEDDEVYGIYGDHIIKPKLTLTKNNAREILGKDAYNWVKNEYEWMDKIQTS